MEALLHQLQDVYTVLLWPFFRFAAALAVAPVLGEALVPVRARMLLALVLAVAVQPALPPPPQVDPVSLHGVVLVFEQVLVGGMIGLAFHLVLAALTLFGVLASSQMGLAMAMLNDPVSGTPSASRSSAPSSSEAAPTGHTWKLRASTWVTSRWPSKAKNSSTNTT